MAAEAALRSGAQSAYTNSGTWSTGAGYGYSYNRATDSSSGSYPSFFRCGAFQCTSIFVIGKGGLSFDTISIGGVNRQIVTWY